MIHDAACPDCSNRLDEDGYCTEPGCKSEGKTPPDTREITATCRACGWSFTVHGVPRVRVYENVTWGCPHCGNDCAEPIND